MGLIPFGKITKSHGLQGEVTFYPFSRSLSNLEKLERIYVKPSNEKSSEELTIIGKKLTNRFAILKFDTINSIDLAEKLKGYTVWVDTEDLEEPGADEYYWFQLIGMDVYTDHGTFVGKVDKLIDITYQTLIVVKHNGKEALIPMVEKFIKDIDLANSKITIIPIEGLID